MAAKLKEKQKVKAKKKKSNIFFTSFLCLKKGLSNLIKAYRRTRFYARNIVRKIRRKKAGIVVAVDVGNYKVSVLVGEYEEEKINILGYGEALSEGMTKGSIADLELQAECITEAVEQAEESSDVDIFSVFVGISDPLLYSSLKKRKIAITNPEKAVSSKDILKLLSLIHKDPYFLEKKILHCFPLKFKLDESKEIKNPLGLFGKELKVEANIVSLPLTSLLNISECIKLVDLEIAGVVLSSLAAGEILLSPEEKNLGVALIDIGGEATDLIVYKNGAPVYVSIITAGGMSLSQEVANQFHIPLKEAERIKKEYSYYTDNLKSIKAKVFSSEKESEVKEKRISSLKLAGILEEKGRNIILKIREELKSFLPALSSGIVVTGGGSELFPLLKMMCVEFKVPVRIGKVRNIPACLKKILSKPTKPEKSNKNYHFLTFPSHLSSLGLFLSGVEFLQGSQNYPWEEKNLYEKTVSKTVNWLKEFFDISF